MALRLADEADLDGLVELRRDCYPNSPPPAELRRRFLENPRFHLSQHLWVVEESEKLIASAVTLPLESYVPGGRCMSLTGLASVAVHPSCRRRGLARRMLTELLRDAQLPAPLAGLYPFESGFYRRLGYAPVVQAQILEVRPQDLAFHPSGHEVENLSPADWSRLAAIYARAESDAGRFGLRRSPEFWAQLLSDLRVYAYRDEGYLLYRHRPNPRQPLTSQVKVVEWLARSPAGWRALSAHLALLQEQVTRIRLPLSIDQPLALLWGEARQPWAREIRGEDYSVGRVSSGMMLRWLDARAAVEGCSYTPELPGLSLTLFIDDPLELCHGCYRLEISGGQASLQPSQDDPQLRAPVGTWTQWWSGACRYTEALAWGELEGDAEVARQLQLRWQRDFAPFVHELDCF